MSMAVEKGATHICTLDYDSVFTHDDVIELAWLMRSYPEADAIFPLQASRAMKACFFCRRKADGKIENEYTADEMSRNIIPMDSGHFGLTVLRVDALKKMPHPWFYGKPNKDGEWDDGKIDDDIAFWEKWKASGNSLYLAPHVVLGHIAEMVIWPDDQLKPRPQPSNEYTVSGKPNWAWR
jgi:hypothetical protein